MLIGFRDGDPNGNRKAFGIPFAFVVNDGLAYHGCGELHHTAHNRFLNEVGDSR